MPKISDTPPALKPFLAHGIDLTWSATGKEALADCPFCGRDRKFTVNVNNGMWHCWGCNEADTDKPDKMTQGSNAYGFLRKLWGDSQHGPGVNGQAQEMQEDRKLLDPETLTAWGLVQSLTTGVWLAPGYNADGKLSNLYRYLETDKGRKAWQATPGKVGDDDIKHQLHGVPLFSKDKATVYVCEGLGDAMILWETLRSTKVDNKGNYLPTSSPDESLLTDVNVLAVPGANVFYGSWARLLAGKRVVLMYDNDHPRKNPKVAGGYNQPVALASMKRVVQLLGAQEDLPAQVDYLHWGDEGYDPKLKDGYDVKDWLSRSDEPAERARHLKTLLARVKPIPQEWAASDAPGKVGIRILPCTEWQTLLASWRKALKWGDGLNRALQVMLACIMSTRIRGDQLWLKIIGPPGCGKSTLCEAVSVNRKYVYPKSTIRGFHSGYKTDKEGKEDHGLLSKVKDKCLVTKDGDTLLRSPNVEGILSEARDIYDRVSRTHYRNKMGKDFEGYSMTWLLCGTESLRLIDASELGERFMDCVIMQGIDDDEELDILLAMADVTDRNMSYTTNGKVEEQHDQDLLMAMQLTGGYISYLCSNAATMLGQVLMSQEAKMKCIHYARFVAHLRARPPRKGAEKPGRELATRLMNQHLKLAKCLAVVLNKKEVDDEVLDLTRKVSLDTARGRTMEILTELHKAGDLGLELKTIALRTGQKKETEHELLRFLKHIGCADVVVLKQGGYTKEPRWVLTPKLRKLWAEVVNG